MLVCTNCGYKNADEAESCLRCGYWLLEPDEPESAAEDNWLLEPDEPEPAAGKLAQAAPILLPGAASTTQRQKVLWFILGAVLGLIPATLFALAWRTWGSIGCVLFVFVLLIMGILLGQKERRPLGYGLLAAVLISPVIVVVACTVTPPVL